MAIIKRRDRIVLFRLSQDEYERLRAACEEDGAASISAFARSEILKVIDSAGPSPVSQQLSSLQSLMEQMTQRLEAVIKSPARCGQNQTVHQHDV
jgi:hypothetical protein